MVILIDIGHPAHVHLFKNFIFYLKSKGHKVIVVSREKDVTNILLEHYKIPYISLSKAQKGFFGMIMELITRTIKIFILHKKYKFDTALGTSASIGFLTLIFGVKSYNFCEDDDNIVPLYAWISYPFCTKIINPKNLKFTKWKNKRVFHNSTQKMAYLHPDVFTPNEQILKKYNLNKYKYIIIRNSAMEAHHDVGQSGLNENLQQELNKITEDYKIVRTKEKDKNFQIDPWDMHDVMAFAKLMIVDSQTMTIESAILGVPCIRYNSLVGKISYLNMMDETYKITFGYRPMEEDKFLNKVKEIINNDNSPEEFNNKRDILLKEIPDMNAWMIEYFENKIN